MYRAVEIDKARNIPGRAIMRKDGKNYEEERNADKLQ